MTPAKGSGAAKRPLEEYRAKRDFGATPEPAGQAATERSHEPRFVVQEHHARRLHWDLRLEHDGVLLSWAVPKGVPWNPNENHLAVHTEDHPLEYLEFSGTIPEGGYGAGSMTIWDHGTYVPLEMGEKKVVVELRGSRVQGRYALFSTRGDDWMIHRMDPPQDPDREPVPVDWRPMEATPGEMPRGKGWAYEIRWVGERVLVAVSGGRAVFRDAEGDDLNERLPELRAVGPALGSTEALLDGVIVAIDEEGKPVHDRERVDRRLGATSDSQARRLARSTPVALVIVDLPWCEGHPLTEVRYDERRDRLTEMGLSGPAWETPKDHRGAGGALLSAAAAQGAWGLVAKRCSSDYRPGEVSGDWLEIRPDA